MEERILSWKFRLAVFLEQGARGEQSSFIAQVVMGKRMLLESAW
jgi:hypothetical protein